MLVREVQPTPNPNAMKYILGGKISDKPLSFFNAESGKDQPLAARLFAINGVTGVLILNDFVTVSKTPVGMWKRITPKVKQVLGDWEVQDRKG